MLAPGVTFEGVDMTAQIEAELAMRSLFLIIALQRVGLMDPKVSYF